MVTKNELQRVLARRQFDARIRLTRTEVQVISIRRNFLVERRQVGIDQQMVVPRIRNSHALWAHAHVAQSHADPQFAAVNYGTI